LVFTVFNDNNHDADSSIIGVVRVPLGSLANNQGIEDSFEVADGKGDSAGTLSLALVWRQPLKGRSSLSLEDEEQRLALSVEETAALLAHVGAQSVGDTTDGRIAFCRYEAFLRFACPSRDQERLQKLFEGEVSRLGHSRSAILDALRLETTAEGDGAPMKFEEFSRAIQRLKLDVEIRDVKTLFDACLADASSLDGSVAEACARELLCSLPSGGSLLLLRTKLRHFLKCSYPGGGDDDGAGPAIGGVALRLRERFQRNDFTETKLLPKDLFLVTLTKFAIDASSN